MSNQQIPSQNTSKDDQLGAGCLTIIIILVLAFFLYSCYTRANHREQLIESGASLCSNCNGNGTVLQPMPLKAKGRVIGVPIYKKCYKCNGTGKSRF
jgi:predicted permease